MKNKFIKSTVILLIGGFITKILGMVIKIVMSRMIGTEGLGLYMMILPTFSLAISLSQFGLPTALIKIISSNKSNNKRLFFSVLLISFCVNIVLIITLLSISKYLSNNLLHNSDTYLGILAIAVVIPFIALSSLCRSYFFGKEKMIPHVISNILEDVVRLGIMVIGIPFFLNKGLKYVVCFLVLSNVVSESISIIVLLLFLPKNLVFSKKDFKVDRNYIKESLSIGIPNTCGRFVGSIGYFLEPIVLTNVLLYAGYSSTYITYEYGILSGYVMPLLLLPSFFTSAISQALFPIISNDYSNGRISNVKRKLILAISICLMIGIPVSICLFMFPNLFLKFLYHTTEGISYIKFLVFICLLHYVQAPLNVCLDAINKSKDAMIASIIGVLLRIGCLIIFAFFRIGIWSLIFAISCNVIGTTIFLIYRVFSYLNK